MPFVSYAILSTLATVAAVWYAYDTREQFYPTMIYLTTSKGMIVVLSNFVLMLTFCVGKMFQAIFLGALHPQEVLVSSLR